VLRVLRLGLTGLGLATFGSLELMRFGLASFGRFGPTSFGLTDFRLTDVGFANRRVRHRGSLRWFPVRPDGLPQDIHENQFDDDDGNPEQTLPWHSHSPAGKAALTYRKHRQVHRKQEEKDQSACFAA
jgi:hypothetical protein